MMDLRYWIDPVAFLPPLPQLDTDDLFSLVRWRKPVRRWRVKARGAEFRRMRASAPVGRYGRPHQGQGGDLDA